VYYVYCISFYSAKNSDRRQSANSQTKRTKAIMVGIGGQSNEKGQKTTGAQGHKFSPHPLRQAQGRLCGGGIDSSVNSNKKNLKFSDFGRSPKALRVHVIFVGKEPAYLGVFVC
jgi:hypothetical protein